MPEHANMDAYAILKNAEVIKGSAVFSPLLPFDESLRQVKLYTEKLGWKRHVLKELMYGKTGPGKYENVSLAAATFDISVSELNVINGSTELEVEIPTGGKVSEVINLMKITYIQLLQLLDTYFLNPVIGEARVLSVRQINEDDEILTCNLDELKVHGLSNTWLAKAARFMRLCKKTGWDMYDVDRALITLGLNDFPGTGEFDIDILLLLYQIEKLKEALHITVQQALALLADFNTGIYYDRTKEGQPAITSLYEQLFENKTLPPLSSGTVEENKELLAALLQTNIAEIDAAGLSTSTVSIPVISNLFRTIMLAKKTGLTVEETFLLNEIADKERKDNGEWDAVVLLQFAEAAAMFKSSGVAVKEFAAFMEVRQEAYKKFGFNTVAIQWLEENKTALGIDEAADLFDVFQQLFILSRLNQFKTKLPSGNWMDLLNTAIGAEANKERYFEHAASLYVVTENALTFLAGSKENVDEKGCLNFTFPNDYINGKCVIELLNACAAVDKLNANAAQMQALLSSNPDDTDAASARNLLKSKYSNEQWLKIIKPISDMLRENKRDALVAWLLASVEGWNDKADIYKYLLIDTEMDACMVTSRIKQAISSVQLYIDRCIMGLEAGVVFEADDDFAFQWEKWRKQYRVWEANRKIFLYPENWIEPELRDGKSPFFKDLESQLKQNEVTGDTAKEALLQYLQKLDMVAKLDIMGLFNDNDNWPVTCVWPHTKYSLPIFLPATAK